MGVRNIGARARAAVAGGKGSRGQGWGQGQPGPGQGQLWQGQWGRVDFELQPVSMASDEHVWIDMSLSTRKQGQICPMTDINF